MTAAGTSAISATSAAPSDELVLSLEKSLTFARLCGDFNPMHVDPVAARRTQYGSTVVHGMHLLLGSIEAACRRGLLRAGDIEALSVVFSNPARTGVPVRLSLQDERAQGKLRITGESDGKVLFTAGISFGDSVRDAALPADAPPAVPRSPVERDMPDADAAGTPEWAGTVPWRLPHTLFTAEFPALAGQSGGLALGADLLACTNIVGMECPGLHSIFSTLKLKRAPGRDSVVSEGVRWQAVKFDPRFRLVRMAVTGGMFEGSIDAFFRPAPVPQATLSSLLAVVAPDAYAGQRALVVGGSRGLGELTAKLLLAGGAHVTITYARGQSDAERVCAEATAHGRTCVALRLDMRNLSGGAAIPESLRGAVSHLYYFASPQILKTSPGQWRAALFDEFSAFYLEGFSELLSALVPAQGSQPPMKVFYPSTAFLDTHEKGFAEYCAAKSAGETLCEHLSAHHGVSISTPRLPRMRTDQTSALVASETEDATVVMRRELDRFCR